MRRPFEPGLLTRLPQPPRKVAILKASRIGDFICSTPAFRALRSALPEAQITLITLPMLLDLGQRLLCFDEVISFPGYPGIAEQLYSPERLLSFLESIQAKHIDLAVQLQGSGVYSNPFLLLLGARWNAGFIRPGDSPGLLDAAIPWPEAGLEEERIQKLPEFLGAPIQDLYLDYPLLPEDDAYANMLLEGFPQPYFGLHPTARELTRRWPIERFVAAGKALVERWGGSLVWIGEGGEDWEVFETARQTLSSPSLNLAGKTSLPVLGALMTKLNVFITNDTGPAHIAYALKVPTITIIGGGDPKRYGPPIPGPFRLLSYPVLCRPCDYTECPIGYKCLNEIKVEQVIEAVEEVMGYRL